MRAARTTGPMAAQAVDAGVIAVVGAVVLFCAWAITRGRIAQRQPYPMIRRVPLSERLRQVGVMDDHLMEWR